MDLNKDVPADIGLIGDAKLTLAALNSELSHADNSKAAARANEPEKINQLKEEWMQEWLPKLTNNEAPINPYRVVAELNQLVDKEKVVITHDAGSPRDQITPFWESTAPLSYIGWGKTTQLGYGLSLIHI